MVDEQFNVDAYCNARGIQPRTREPYRYAVRRFTTWLEQRGRVIDNDSVQLLHEFERDLHTTGLKQTTVINYVRLTTYYLTWLADNGQLDERPSYVVPSRPKDWGTPSTISIEQLRDVLSSARDDRMYSLVSVLAFTGIKPVDVLTLDVSDVVPDGDAATIHLVRRQGRLPYTQLHPEVAERLFRYIGGRTRGPLFVNREGARLGRSAASGVLTTAGRRAGLPFTLTSNHLYNFLPTHALRLGFSYRSVIRAVGIVQPNQSKRWLQTLTHPDDSHAGIRLTRAVLHPPDSDDSLVELLAVLRDDSELPEAFTVIGVGALYERHLRALCLQHSLPVPHDIKKGTIAKYTALLHDAKRINLQQRQECEQLGEWRNQAAHGNFEAILEGTAPRAVALLRRLRSEHPLAP